MDKKKKNKRDIKKNHGHKKKNARDNFTQKRKTKWTAKINT